MNKNDLSSYDPKLIFDLKSEDKLEELGFVILLYKVCKQRGINQRKLTDYIKKNGNQLAVLRLTEDGYIRLYTQPECIDAFIKASYKKKTFTVVNKNKEEKILFLSSEASILRLKRGDFKRAFQHAYGGWDAGVDVYVFELYVDKFKFFPFPDTGDMEVLNSIRCKFAQNGLDFENIPEDIIFKAKKMAQKRYA